jgi:LPS O-antigen subunit length determinant protein (WzzB/FepE family)
MNLDNHSPSNIEDDLVIDIKEIIIYFWSKKVMIFFVSLFFLICSITYSYTLPNIYTSSVLLAPVNQENNLSSKLGGLSPLASIGGFSIPSSNYSKSQEAIERIKSYEFFKNHFLPNIQLKNLMAILKWNAEDNIMIYDPDLYNTNDNKWDRDLSKYKSIAPSSQESYDIYQDILTIKEDADTSFVTISMYHHSPVVAKKWVDIIIYQINESMRKIDAKAAENSIKYLNGAAQSTSVQSLKEVSAKLLEDQMQILMLTSSNDFYVYKIIDSPIVKERKSSPNRPAIALIGVFFGITFALLIALFQRYRELN